MTRIDREGVYDIPASQYHADPCMAPSLSSSLIKILDDQSPQHAYAAHPRLGLIEEDAPEKTFDLGSAAHALILGSNDELEVIDPAKYPSKTGSIPKGWTNDAIREARDAAYEAGKIPLLPDQFDAACKIAHAAFCAMEQNDELRGWRSHGYPEKTLVWREKNGIWCRARLDWIPQKASGIYLDIKTTETSVNPEVLGRYATNMNWDIQEAFYRRGLAALGIVDKARFRFVAVEQKPPYAVTVAALPPEVQDHADHKVQDAVDLWGKCLSTDDWPGYPTKTVFLESPAYAFMRHQERWARSEAMFTPKAKPTETQKRTAMEMQRP